MLSDSQIKKAMQAGEIVIRPFIPELLGSNSYDVRLGNVIKAWDLRAPGYLDSALDPEKHPAFKIWTIPKSGFVLQPNTLYLASTLEYTESHKHVPFLDGKSSTGRLGIMIHSTAGKGDVGFCGHWTLEISCRVPVKVYAGMPIGQLFWHECGQVVIPYGAKESAKYQDQGSEPVSSKMFLNRKYFAGQS